MSIRQLSCWADLNVSRLPEATVCYQICLLVLNVEDIVEGSASLGGVREREVTDQRASALCVLEVLLLTIVLGLREEHTDGRARWGGERTPSFPEREELRLTP